MNKNKQDKRIEKVVDKFETEFLDLWFPKQVDVSTLDGDSRGMRERGRDFVRKALQDQKENEEYISKAKVKNAITLFQIESKDMNMSLELHKVLAKFNGRLLK